MQSRTVFIFFLAFACLLWFGGFCAVIILQKMGFLAGTAGLVSHMLTVLLPLVLVGTLAYGYNHTSSLNAAVHALSSTWIVFVSGFFIAALLGGALYSIFAHAGLLPSATVFGWLVVGVGLLYGIFGIVSARTFVTNEVTLPVASESPLIGKRIALVSDLHIGLIQRRPFLERVVERLNATEPDLVMIAGDLIDGPRFDYSRILAPLADIAAPVLYAPGNHERYNQDQEAFYGALPDSVTILRNDAAMVGSLTILGIDDQPESAQDMMARINAQHDNLQPTIVMLHDPKHRAFLQALNPELVVSGHTHGGQLFPSTLLVRRLYKEKTAGLVTSGDTHFFTTVGIGTGGTPARIGTRPEVVVFSFVAKTD
jgi:hypothetical protein